MKIAFSDDSDGSVFNDYEKSITFDEDDPDFKPVDDLRLKADDSKFDCHSSQGNNENGKSPKLN